MAKTAPAGRRTVVWIAAAVVLVVIIAAIVIASSGGGATSSTSTHSNTSTASTTTTTQTCAGSSTSQTITIISGPVLVGASGKVAAGITCADGHLGTILTYAYGQPIDIQVTVQNSLIPTAIQTVVDGNPQGVNPWNVTSSGRTYVEGFGGAGQTPLTACTFSQVCQHNIYASVTFSDNSTATSNVVYITVTGTPAA